LPAIFLDAHLAELLSTARRWRDLIATVIATNRVATLWNRPWSYINLDAHVMAGRSGKAFVAASSVVEASTTIIDDRVRRGVGRSATRRISLSR
jgi:hypothetical protein